MVAQRKIFGDIRKLLGVINMFIIFIVMMVSHMHTFVKANQIIHFKYMIYCISVISQKSVTNKNSKHNSFENAS